MTFAGRTWLLQIVLAAGAFGATPVFAQDKGSEIKRGERILARNCSKCHAIGRTGSSPHRQAPPFRTLSKRYPIDSLSEALGEGLSTGHPDMPEFVFPPRDIGAILSYLQSIQQK
jgi:mono/diheme cytochrome c family protein